MRCSRILIVNTLCCAIGEMIHVNALILSAHRGELAQIYKEVITGGNGP